MNIIDRQTIVISINCNNFNTNPVTRVENKSEVNVPINLRFAAHELVFKSLVYGGFLNAERRDVVQIWCSIAQDNIIGAFPNGGQLTMSPDQHSFFSTAFQSGTMTIQLQTVDTSTFPYVNPQPLISSLNLQTTTGCLVLTFEFIRYDNKKLV